MVCLRMFVASVAVAVASANREGQQYYWSGKNGDALRTGASTHVAVSDLSAGPTWSYPDAASAAAWPHMLVRSHPLIDDELNIYLAIVSLVPDDGPGAIIKFDPDGTQMWNWTADAPLPNGPALLEGSLFVMADTGNVYALNMETGTLQWNVSALPEDGGDGAPDTHSMTAAEGHVIVPVRTNKKMIIPAIEPCFKVIDDTIIQEICSNEVSRPGGGPENQLVAMDPATGEVLWRFDSDTIIYNSLSAVVDGSLVVADTTGRTYRLDLATGEVLWKHESADYATANFTGMSTGGAIVGPNRVVYVTSNVGVDVMNDANGRISAYALETGALLWRHDLELPANNAAAVGPISPDGTGPLAVVVVIGENPGFPPQKPGNKDGKAIAFDAESGERLAWQFDIHWPFEAAAGDTLPVKIKIPLELDPDTQLPATEPTGDPTHLCLPDDASNPAIGGDGSVYFGFEDGHVYALRDADGDGQLSTDEVSSYDGGNAYQGSPGIAPGLLVTCPCNGMHVFRSPAPAASGLAPPAEMIFA